MSTSFLREPASVPSARIFVKPLLPKSCTLPFFPQHCWGYNGDGQATVPDGSDYVAIAAGERHNLALKSDGTIVGWGDSYHGQTPPPIKKHWSFTSEYPLR
jgi:hypothetical protein